MGSGFPSDVFPSRGHRPGRLPRPEQMIHPQDGLLSSLNLSYENFTIIQQFFPSTTF